MRHPSEITHNGVTLAEILEDHAKWLRGEGGKCADLRGAILRGADLQGAILRGANLQGAILWDAILWDADLRGADLWGAILRDAILSDADLSDADLSDADLSDANLSDADLSDANLSDANLSDANLSDANLSDANLSGANLRGANLLCMGNKVEIRTMQIDTWAIGYTADTLQIGCQSHSIEKWRKWGTDAGRAWIAKMDAKALEWADRNLALVLAIIDANPATPTGHEAADLRETV